MENKPVPSPKTFIGNWDPSYVSEIIRKVQTEDEIHSFLADTLEKIFTLNIPTTKYIETSKHVYQSRGRGVLVLQISSIEEATALICNLTFFPEYKIHLKYIPEDKIPSKFTLTERIKTYNPETQAILLIELKVKEGKIIYRCVALE